MKNPKTQITALMKSTAEANLAKLIADTDALRQGGHPAFKVEFNERRIAELRRLVARYSR